MNILITFIVSIVTIKLFFTIEKRLEKYYLSSNKKVRGRIIENKSRKIFRVFSLIWQFVAAIEISCLHVKFECNVYFVILTVIFIILRIAAIRELKEMWSFDVEVKYKHYLVQSGIYRLLDHPAYIGNAFIPLFFLFIGAINTSIFCSICLAGFYVYRTSYEDAIINKLHSKNNKRYELVRCNESYLASTLSCKVKKNAKPSAALEKGII